jgi:hypothetical protein
MYQYFSTSLSLTCIDIFVMDIEQSPTYITLPEHATPAWLRVIRALPYAWLVAPATGEIFEGKEDCHQRLQGWGLFEASESFKEGFGRMGVQM